MVRRSASLRGEAYGSELHYQHYMALKSRVQIAGLMAFLGGLFVATRLEPTRKLVAGVRKQGEGPAPEVAANTVLAAAPTVGGGTTPAATLWWDGFTIAKNISDEDAEASFQAMMHGIRPEVAQEHAPVAVWLIKGYEPTPAAVGVIETLKAGAKPFPMLPYMGVLFTALGENLAEFMQGQESAEQALEDATQAYNTAAREAGFLN